MANICTLLKRKWKYKMNNKKKSEKFYLKSISTKLDKTHNNYAFFFSFSFCRLFYAPLWFYKIFFIYRLWIWFAFGVGDNCINIFLSQIMEIQTNDTNKYTWVFYFTCTYFNENSPPKKNDVFILMVMFVQSTCCLRNFSCSSIFLKFAL